MAHADAKRTKHLRRALRDDMFKQQSSYVTRWDFSDVMSDWKAIKASKSDPGSEGGAMLTWDHSRFYSGELEIVDPIDYCDEDLLVRIVSVELHSSLYKRRVFCELTVNMRDTIMPVDVCQSVRRTFVAMAGDQQACGVQHASDLQQGDDKSKHFLKSVFDFQNPPQEFHIPRMKKRLKLELQVYYIVEGIRMKEVCRGHYNPESDHPKGSITIELHSYEGKNSHHFMGKAELDIGFSPRKRNDDSQFNGHGR